MRSMQKDIKKVAEGIHGTPSLERDRNSKNDGYLMDAIEQLQREVQR